MFAITTILVLLTIGFLVVLFETFRQNRKLWREVRSIRRSVRNLLWDSLVLWSPLALVIVVLAFAANRLSNAMVGLTYRLTTLDEFCEVRDVPGRFVIPCTGLGDNLALAQIRGAGAQSDLEYFVARRYQEARKRLLALSADDLRKFANQRVAFYRAFSPQGVLALELAPEDDYELVRLKRELRELVKTPAKPASGVLDLVRYVTERDARLQRMKILTALVLARREAVNQEAYAGLNRERQGRLWLRHRVSHLVAQRAGHPGGATEAALTAIAIDPASARDALIEFRRGMLTLLAKDEAAVVDALIPDTKTRIGSAALYFSLAVDRRCTVAARDESLRQRAADFVDDGVELRDLENLLQSNGGAFRCLDRSASPTTLELESLGFEESVRRSIDRWHEQMVNDSFRRVGKLGLDASTVWADANTSNKLLVRAVPSTIHLGRSECGLLHPANCAANAVNSAIESKVAQTREELLGRYQLDIDSASNAAELTFDQRMGQRLLTLDDDLESLRISAHERADQLFLVRNLLRLLGWLAVALIAIKSYLYVMALELFHSDEEMAIGFGTSNQVEGEFRSARRLTIDREFATPLITRKQLSNTDNNVCLAPWPWSAPLARILHGRYFIFTKGTFLADADQPAGSDQSQRGMVASAGSGLSIVEWKMRPGEEVIFRYKDFYGASENVKLATEFSFRLSTLLLGRIIFRIARCGEGEGRLLLKANVEDIDQKDIRAVPPERMIAWSRHAQFTIHSGRTLWKTLLNGYTLVRRERADGPSGRIVVSSDDIGSNLGSIRFVKRIFSAIF
jgi:hypothetical protein